MERDWIGCRMKITFENPKHLTKGVSAVTVDGVRYAGNIVPREAVAGKKTVSVSVVIG